MLAGHSLVLMLAGRMCLMLTSGYKKQDCKKWLIVQMEMKLDQILMSFVGHTIVLAVDRKFGYFAADYSLAL